MGFLDIIKRGKNTESASASLNNNIDNSLPALPQGIPEIPPPPSNMQDNIPQYDIPPIDTALPEMPEATKLDTPEMPELPKMPDIPKAPTTALKEPMEPLPIMEKTGLPEIPKDFPAPSAGSYVPDKIPPLEGLGEIPTFKEESELEIPMQQAYQPQTKPIISKPHKGPMFVKVTAFKNLISTMDSVLVRFKDEDDIFFRLTDIKNTQDKKFESYRQTLEDMQRKLLFVDKILFDR